MPSLKKATTRKRRYGGSREGSHLKNAINLLFQLKGAEYQEEHPDFIIPTADEFFGFVALVDADLTITRRAINTTHKQKFRQITPNKDIMLVSPHHGGSRITDFLSFILKKVIGPYDTPCERFFSCLSIVLYAVMVYTFLDQYITIADPVKTLKQNASEILASEAYKNSLANPLRWFLSHHLPSVLRFKEWLISHSSRFLETCLFPIVPSHLSDVSITAESIGRGILSAVDALLINPAIQNRFFKRPIACYLSAEGFTSCQPICDELRGVARSKDPSSPKSPSNVRSKDKSHEKTE